MVCAIQQQRKQRQMAEYSFLEFSYDPSITSTDVITDYLRRLGFIHRSQHESEIVGFWNLQNCILLLRKTHDFSKGRITGIGFNGDKSLIENLDCVFDTSSGLHVTDNSFGLRTYIVQEDQLNPYRSELVKYYKPVDDKTKGLNHIEYISGIKLNAFNDRLVEHYTRLGFKYADVSETYGKLTCENNRFTIMLDKRSESGNVTTIISDTHDVFDATAFFTAQGIRIKRFNHNVHEKFGTKLNYKIRAYNCRAWGNEKSYTIENFIYGVAPGLDIIFRQRNQYLHIQETTLESYYATEH